MTIFSVICMGMAIATGIFGYYSVKIHIATEDLGETRYMLRCAKERYKIVSKENGELSKIAKEEVERLEEKYRNHWGWKYAGNRSGSFDYIMTPGEERRLKERR